MSALTRYRAYDRAVERGRRDNAAGVPRTSNPYKVSEWGLGGWWDMGWQEAERIRGISEKEQAHV